MSEENKELEGDSLKPEGEGADKPKEYSESEKQLHARATRAEAKLKEIEGEIQGLKGKSEPTAEDKRELEAKQYLKNLLKETLKEEKDTEAQAKAKEEETFGNEVNNILAINTDVKRADFLKFIEDKAESYGIESIEGAMRLYKDLGNITKETSDKTKKDILGKPKLPQSEGDGISKTPPDDKGKSLWQIAQEAIQGLSKK